MSGPPSRSDTVTPTPHDGRLGLRVAAAALPAEADLRTWFADVARLGRESSGRCADVCNGSPLARDRLLRLAARFSVPTASLPAKFGGQFGGQNAFAPTSQPSQRGFSSP